MNKGPLAIKEFIPQMIEKMGVTADNYVLLSLIERELHAIHPGIEIVAFKNNKIYVEVESSVVLYELNIRKREMKPFTLLS